MEWNCFFEFFVNAFQNENSSREYYIFLFLSFFSFLFFFLFEMKMKVIPNRVICGIIIIFIIL